MKPVAWMVAACIASWLGAAAFLSDRGRIEVLCGMLGPLVVAIGTWLLAEWTYRRDPLALPRVMAAAFFGKMLFFAGYVTVMLRLLPIRPVPFVISFTCYFIVLYLMDALYLQRLVSGRPR